MVHANGQAKRKHWRLFFLETCSTPYRDAAGVSSDSI
jgi:hypothetical protein